VLFINKKS